MIVTNPKSPKGIVWIASYPKSGNTWMRVYLYHLMRLANGLPRADNDLHALDKASTYEARLFGLFEQFLGKSLATATQQDVALVRPQVHAAIVQRSPGVALIKTHNLMGQIGNIPIINLAVSAGTIYIVRDPRDVAISLAAHNGSSVDQAIEDMARSGYHTQNSDQAAFEIWGSWSEHSRSWTEPPHDAVLVVRYEDMLADPLPTFTAVARHLRQKPTPEQIEEAVALSSFDELRQAEVAAGDFRERSERADRFFREGRAGEWREKLTSSQVERIAETHGEMMRRFGYLTN
jgi:hypothetical protein